MQIHAPPLWFVSPYSPNVDKHVVYTKWPSFLKREGVHENEPIDSMVMYT